MEWSLLSHSLLLWTLSLGVGGRSLTGGIWEGRKNRRAPTGPPCGVRAQAAGAWLGEAHKRKQREGNGSLRSTTPVLVPALPQVLTPWADHFPHLGSVLLYL